MANTVKINIDGQAYEVPAGSNVVDVSKFYADNDIPVFCYHPKMSPVGMCRMCLVEMGTPNRDRATGELIMNDDGTPQIRWNPKLQTACTMTATDGLHLRTQTQEVAEARQNVLEFILTSHPLDCPICDKGGECPLQNLTMRHGPGVSRMYFDDKIRLDKHVPLGDLIFLDEERCIQCARCVRFQEEVVGDDVLAFHERGRSLQIIAVGDPPFDTYFSGNTTDICPVGALTTADFRFGARPWELTEVPSICPHCPVGCNISLSTRLERDFGGRAAIKRVMPRQNEAVNEIWICDKARFGHHFTRSADRLTEPLLVKPRGRMAVKWDEALTAAAEFIQAAGGDVAAIAGPSLSNEDLWSLKKLVNGAGSERLGAWPPTHGGVDLLMEVGVGAGTELKSLGTGDAVLVIASDLEEEAPVWRLHIKQARDRGAYVVVANARPTRMDDFASATIRYNYGDGAAVMRDLRRENAEIAQRLADADNLIIIAGVDGLTLDGSRALMQAAANFLIETSHVGRPLNGLLMTTPGANAVGAAYFGYTPEAALDIAANPPKVLIVAGADVLGDDPTAAAWIDQVETIISLTLFDDDVAQRAQVALPIQSFAERDGTFTNGERRVQRFYTAQGPLGMALPAWQAIARLGEKLGQGRPALSASMVMLEITREVPAFEGARYNELSKVERQFPDVGGEDLYYGGTAYKNTGGLGVQLGTSETAAPAEVSVPDGPIIRADEIAVVPTTRLYNRERTFAPSANDVLRPRVPEAYAELNSADANARGIADGDTIDITVGANPAVRVRARVNGTAPQGVILLPRHLADEAAPLTVSAATVSKVQEPEPAVGD
ncbi:MAG: NADH-quinone oxidoreductase subunit NuoG [Chloroflexi bacterium]|nr:NADH-quinone oxidoreductase subunit NuoG [Chloroflexota bacterium]